jgi:hypothetical protein
LVIRFPAADLLDWLKDCPPVPVLTVGWPLEGL